ncbi:MAG: hypothetical protein VYA27_07020, partial [Verrucomicrobiota bacterium]|nr:hypothetical protein [Verrucomicrobiota bacterium]
MNALWDDVGVGTQLLSLTLQCFLNPWKGSEVELHPPPLHRVAWKVVDDETRRLDWGDVASGDSEESLQRILCPEPG